MDGVDEMEGDEEMIYDIGDGHTLIDYKARDTVEITRELMENVIIPAIRYWDANGRPALQSAMPETNIDIKVGDRVKVRKVGPGSEFYGQTATVVWVGDIDELCAINGCRLKLLFDDGKKLMITYAQWAGSVYYHSVVKVEKESDGIQTDSTATHWMPLPDPPEVII